MSDGLWMRIFSRDVYRDGAPVITKTIKVEREKKKRKKNARMDYN